MRGERLGFDPTQVALAATAIGLGVAIQALLPGACHWHAQSITLTHYWRVVAHDEHAAASIALAQEGERALLIIVRFYPLKAVLTEVAGMQRWFANVESIQIAHPGLHASMQGILQHIPFQALVMRPFAPLTELASHEQ